MWGTFWEIIFLISVLLFAALAAAVTVAGFRDARTMFRRLREGKAQSNSADSE